LIRSVTIREPTWTEQDRAEALALSQYWAGLCPGGCGHPVAETTTHEDDGPEYTASAKTCRACHARLEAQGAVADGHQANPYAPARLWHIRKLRKG
jgi:hypothetical protein